MRGRRFIAAVAVGLAGVLSAAAQEAPELEASVRSGAVTVGDVVQVTIHARGGRDLAWGELQVATTDSGEWALVQSPRPVAASRPPVWDVLLAPMQVGEIVLPEFGVTARAEDGTVVQIQLVSPPSVTVASVLPPGEESAPSPMRQPVGVQGFPWEWIAPALVVLLPFALVGVWMMRRARGGAQGSEPAMAPLDELEALMSQLAERTGKDPRELVCDRLAAGLRRFLERRCGEPAAEMTTLEMRALARNASWPEPVQRALAAAMNTADSVRFSKREISESGLRAAIDSALATGHGLDAHLSSLELESPGEDSQEAVA